MKTQATPHISDSIRTESNRDVLKLQKRIFRAEKEGNKRQVHKLQRLLLTSQANLISAIYIVANDMNRHMGEVIDNTLIEQVSQDLKDTNIFLHKPKHFDGDYKKLAKNKDLLKAIFKDRVVQYMIRRSLEPQLEVHMSASIDGFRLGRGQQDALARIHKLVSESNYDLVSKGKLDLDLNGRLNYEFFLDHLEGYPAATVLARWLEAGILEDFFAASKDESLNKYDERHLLAPLLINLVLMDIESELYIKYAPRKFKAKSGKQYIAIAPISPAALSTYGLEIAIFAKNERVLKGTQENLKRYLTKFGLLLTEEETPKFFSTESKNPNNLSASVEMSNTTKDFNIGDFQIHINEAKKQKVPTLFIMPSKRNVNRAKKAFKEIFENGQSQSIESLIDSLNTKIKDIQNYFGYYNVKKTFDHLDFFIYKNVERFLKRRHPNKSWKWIQHQYFDSPQGYSHGKTLVDHDSGKYLLKFRWLPRRGHNLIKHKASFFDPKFADYFNDRRRRKKEKLSRR